MLFTFLFFLFYQSMHGMHHSSEGPRGIFDQIIVGISIIIVLVVIFLTIKYFIKPGENQQDHIKRIILKDEKTVHLEGKK